MTRLTQYRFLAAGAVAVAWIALSVYLGLDRPDLHSTLALPVPLVRGLGLRLAPLIGRSAGALVAVVAVWALVTTLLFGLAEAWVRARTSR